MAVDSERMARILLADYERVTRGDRPGWLSEHEQQTLYDDLLSLLGSGPVDPRTVGARTPMLAAAVTTPSTPCNQSLTLDALTVLGLSPAMVARVIASGTLEVVREDVLSGGLSTGAPPSSPSHEDRIEGSLELVGERFTTTIAETVRASLAPLVTELGASRHANERQAARVAELEREIRRLMGDLAQTRATQPALEPASSRLLAWGAAAVAILAVVALVISLVALLSR